MQGTPETRESRKMSETEAEAYNALMCLYVQVAASVADDVKCRVTAAFVEKDERIADQQELLDMVPGMHERIAELEAEIEATTAETLRLCRQHAKWIKDKDERIAELEAALSSAFEEASSDHGWTREAYAQIRKALR